MKNQYEIKGNITEIYIQSPKYGLKTVLVDTGDLELVSQYSWCVGKESNNFYCKDTTRQHIPLHNLIMNSKPIDHINHNGLDNRRSNLRKCTNRENQGNRKINTNNTSGYKGVCLHTSKYNKYWYSQIKFNNKQIHLGYFQHTEEGKIQAAIQYDLSALKLFGEFALLNFPNKDYSKLLKEYKVKKDIYCGT